MNGSLQTRSGFLSVINAQNRHISKMHGLIFVIAACTYLTLIKDGNLRPLGPLLRQFVSQALCLKVCVPLQHLQGLVPRHCGQLEN